MRVITNRLFFYGVLACLLGLAGVAYAQSRDFENPSSSDPSQQFPPGNVQRQDTPTDTDYDRAEPDDPDGRSSTDLFTERYDLFGFASALTPQAVYKGGPYTGRAQVSGFNAAGAWKITRGRPDVVIAILDTGIRWDNPGVRTQVYLNAGTATRQRLPVRLVFQIRAKPVARLSVGPG